MRRRFFGSYNEWADDISFFYKDGTLKKTYDGGALNGIVVGLWRYNFADTGIWYYIFIDPYTQFQSLMGYMGDNLASYFPSQTLEQAMNQDMADYGFKYQSIEHSEWPSKWNGISTINPTDRDQFPGFGLPYKNKVTITGVNLRSFTLPPIFVWQRIWDNLDVINNAIAQVSGSAIDKDVYYWTFNPALQSGQWAVSYISSTSSPDYNDSFDILTDYCWLRYCGFVAKDVVTS